MRKAVALLLILLFMSVCQASAALSPLEVVKTHIDKVITTATNKKLSTKEKTEKIKNILDKAIDWPYVAKLVLGVHYKKVKPDEFKHFQQLFKEFIKKVYARKFLKYSGEKIVYKKESIQDGIATVDMTLITTKGQKIPITCRLSQHSGEWFIYDVLIEGISMVNNYRIQINRIIARKGFKGLIRILEKKAK